jgi:hypothetical protein
MKDWYRIAKGLGLNISDDDIERMTPALDSLEAGFRPLLSRLTLELDSALSFQCTPRESE